MNAVMQKLLFIQEGQLTPAHLHKAKHEDIINRAGGDLVIEFCAADEKGKITSSDVTVLVDGIEHRLSTWEP